MGDKWGNEESINREQTSTLTRNVVDTYSNSGVVGVLHAEALYGWC